MTDKQIYNKWNAYKLVSDDMPIEEGTKLALLFEKALIKSINSKDNYIETIIFPVIYRLFSNNITDINIDLLYKQLFRYTKSQFFKDCISNSHMNIDGEAEAIFQFCEHYNHIDDLI